MSATIPCLKGFLGRFQTGDLARLSESDVLTAYGSDNAYGRPHGDSYVLSSMDGQGRPGKVKRVVSQLGELRPDNIHYTSHAYGQRGATGDSRRSSGSEQMIIRRRVDIDVVEQ